MAFNNPGYMTPGFQAGVPIDTQQMIFTCLNKAKQPVTEMDYLQVFMLDKFYSNGSYLQRIIRKQEIPPFEETVFLTLPEDQIITTKVFVIDDGDHHTFLLASEYKKESFSQKGDLLCGMLSVSSVRYQLSLL